MTSLSNVYYETANGKVKFYLNRIEQNLNKLQTDPAVNSKNKECASRVFEAIQLARDSFSGAVRQKEISANHPDIKRVNQLVNTCQTILVPKFGLGTPYKTYAALAAGALVAGGLLAKVTGYLTPIVDQARKLPFVGETIHSAYNATNGTAIHETLTKYAPEAVKSWTAAGILYTGATIAVALLATYLAGKYLFKGQEQQAKQQ